MRYLVSVSEARGFLGFPISAKRCSWLSILTPEDSMIQFCPSSEAKKKRSGRK
jgi:hypothetical protein